MDNTVPNTTLSSASINALRSCVLGDAEAKSLDELASVDIVRMLFNIQTPTPAQVEIMSNVINAVGGMRDELVAVLRNKYAEGPIWTFTTDFGIKAVLSKIQNKSGANPLQLSIVQEVNDFQYETRPLVEFTGGQCKFFEIARKELVTREPTDPSSTPIEKENENVSAPTGVQEPIQGSGMDGNGQENQEAEPEQTSEQDESAAQEGLGEGSQAEGEGLTAVNELPDETPPPPESVSSDQIIIPTNAVVDVDGVPKLRVRNKVAQAVTKIIDSGQATVQLIGDLIRPNLEMYDIGIEYSRNTVFVILKERTEPLKPAPVPVIEPPAPVKTEPTAEELKQQQDLDTLLGIEAYLRTEFQNRDPRGQVELLKEVQAKIKAIDQHVRKEIFSKEYSTQAVSLATCFRDLSVLANENLQAQLEKEKAKLEETMAEEDEIHAEAVEEPKKVELEPTDKVVVIEEEEPTEEETKEMTVRIDCPATIPNEDYEKIKSYIASIYGPPDQDPSDAEKSKLLSAEVGYECILTTVTPGEEYVVTIPVESEIDDSAEKVDAEGLKEAMTTDERPETQALDLADPVIREPFMQILFPGVSYPSYTHLMTFLKKFHTEEQTKTFIATKGSIPTETTIVYDNVTFCIVKMKESRFYRIFIANTDYDLKDHGWCETNYIQGRWNRLGQDIHNPCFQNEGIIDNRGGYRRGFGR